MKLYGDIIVQPICLIVSPNIAVYTYPCNILEHRTCERFSDQGGTEEVLHGTVHASICGCIHRQQRNWALSWWPSYEKLLCVHNLNWDVLVKDKSRFFIHPVYIMQHKMWITQLTEKLVFFVHVWVLQQNLASGDEVLCLVVGSWISRSEYFVSKDALHKLVFSLFWVVLRQQMVQMPAYEWLLWSPLFIMSISVLRLQKRWSWCALFFYRRIGTLSCRGVLHSIIVS